jgi:la-related protein 1
MAATFSYAQAAKGISSPVSVSKPASGSATPAKDDASKAPITSIAQGNSWADDAETESSNEQPATNGESGTTSSKPTKPTESLEASTTDLDSLSASTVTKDDDTSSQPNTSSESTWDNKSQASTSVDKTVEPVQKTSEKPEKGEKGRKGKKGEKGDKAEKKEPEKEKEPPKPLKEAPLPTVNIWQQRADQQKSQAKPVSAPVTNGAPKKSEGRPATAETKPKGREEDKASSQRKETRDAEKKGPKSRPYDKDAKPTSSAMPLPPTQDQESWPTPETAIDEDRKKAQEKGEKERKDSTPNGTSGKQEWVKVPYTPSVVFNTPLPNAANSRRGGRPGGRGGAQSGGRPAGFGANGVATSEKDVSTDAVVNGEQPKREVNGIAGDDSPKTKRSGSAASPTLKEQVPAVNGEKSLKGPGAAPFEPEAPKRASTMGDMTNGNFPRQYSGRPGKGRRGDFNGSERRREGDVSPSKDGNQTEGSENERRPFDGPNGVHSKGRFNGSYAGRDRPRGGGRGGRGGFTNGHQFTNGHAQQASGSFTMGPGSPTTFNPGNNSFFVPPQGKFGRNSHRSQSVAEPYRYPGFQGAPSMTPVSAYNMYDYNMAAPVSAVPYNPYSVDQFAMFQMITTQV